MKELLLDLNIFNIIIYKDINISNVILNFESTSEVFYFTNYIKDVIINNLINLKLENV
jgi:hypothetical protein